MGSLRAILLSVVLAAPALFGRVQNPTPQANPQEVPTYPDSDDGFRVQLNAAVRAHCSGDTVMAERLQEEFKLPDSATWFAQNFDPGDAASLADRYNRLFPQYAVSLHKTIEDVCRAKGAELVARHMEESREAARVWANLKLSAIHPLRELSFATFGFAIRFLGKDEVSWVETFVYEKGEFRFIGLGARPFWIWKEAPHPAVWGNGHFHQPPVLIHQVPPDYPIGAEAQHIQGDVLLRARVDKEGKVANVEVLQGDPLLVDAAKKAVSKWRYQPPTLGGLPTETDVNIVVSFKLPND